MEKNAVRSFDAQCDEIVAHGRSDNYQEATARSGAHIRYLQALKHRHSGMCIISVHRFI